MFQFDSKTTKLKTTFYRKVKKYSKLCNQFLSRSFAKKSFKICLRQIDFKYFRRLAQLSIESGLNHMVFGPIESNLEETKIDGKI